MPAKMMQKPLPEHAADQIAAISKIPAINRSRFYSLLSSACRHAWQAYPVKPEPLRAAGVRRQLAKLLKDPDAALEGDSGQAARTFLTSVQVANLGMGFRDAVGRAIFHVTEDLKTRLPNRGRSTGTTGNPAFNSFWGLRGLVWANFEGFRASEGGR
jgi:hypothetical protein